MFLDQLLSVQRAINEVVNASGFAALDEVFQDHLEDTLMACDLEIADIKEKMRKDGT